MKKPILLCFVLGFLLLLSHVVEARTIIAIMPFEGTEIRNWYIDRQQMIAGITEALTDQIAILDGVTVVERSRLDQILREQDFGRSGRIDTLSAAEIGRLLGADVLILGTVQTLNVQETGGIQISFLSAKGSKATIGLSIRMVDADTGIILGSVQATGTHVGASIAVHQFHGISFYSESFKNSTLGKAVDKAVEELAAKFAQEYQTYAFQPKSETVGNIVAVVGDRYVVNLGSRHHVKRGDRFEVYETIRVKGIAAPVEVPVGRMRIISVDPEACVGESEDGLFEEGYVVRKQ
ncbi:MAG: hypothetical protein GX249_08290 [Firmicutes bacterium]|nr:hypothetical protein [Bacillota bacterium]